jgi:hypothetical protein
MEKLLFAKRFQFRLGVLRLDFATVGHNAETKVATLRGAWRHLAD